MEITTKFSPEDVCFYINPQGRVMEGKVEAVYITSGSIVERVSHWVETARGKVKTQIIYKLYNMPAGYQLTEESVFKNKEEIING